MHCSFPVSAAATFGQCQASCTRCNSLGVTRFTAMPLRPNLCRQLSKRKKTKRMRSILATLWLKENSLIPLLCGRHVRDFPWWIWGPKPSSAANTMEISLLDKQDPALDVRTFDAMHFQLELATHWHLKHLRPTIKALWKMFHSIQIQ